MTTGSFSAAQLTELTTALADRYRLERQLGAGGMATVWLAEDVRHRRRVAVKVLHPELSAALGPERFLKEIELTASLQHPHILPLFDSGNAEGQLYYVMPYVEGETLRARLERERQLPIPNALSITREVADALAYAHARGVVHRDIKPENILLQNGHALVADFGIALAVEQAGAQRMTQTGLSLGTPQYMAPEQAMGEKNIDARADIYALGVVTYEMLAGAPPFTGPNAQSILAQVLTAEPSLASTHRKSIPEHVDAAIETALAKLPADRWSSASAFVSALDDPGISARRIPRAGSRASRMRWPVAMIGAGVLGAAALAVWTGVQRNTTPGRPLRASLLPPAGCIYAPVATTDLVQLSPDGEQLALIAECGTEQALWIRTLSTGEIRKLPGTHNAAYVFWSADDKSVGFFADGRLKRIDLQTNAVRDLAAALNGRGGSWSKGDVILYSPDVASPMFVIPASGGTPQPASNITGRLPQFLPDGKHFLFSAPGSGVTGTVRVGELGERETSVLLDLPSNVALANDRLLYATGGLLMARPFDAQRAVFTGPAVSLVAGLENWPYRFVANFSAAASGEMLVYRPAAIESNRVLWFDPISTRTTPVLEPGRYLRARLSPNGHQLITEQRDPDTGLRALALYDIADRTWSTLSRRPSVYFTYGWSADGSRIGFYAEDDKSLTILSPDRTFARSVPNTGGVDILDWTADPHVLIGQRQQAGTGWDILRLELGDSALRATPIIASTADESGARLSPDGKMIAFVSNETGRDELYVTRLADPNTRWQISSSGVLLEPAAHRASLAWSRTGALVYFADPGGHLFSVEIKESPAVRIGRAMPVAGAPDAIVDLDVGTDGRLLLVRGESSEQMPLEIIERWTSLAHRP